METILITEKTCRKCGKILPLTEFYQDNYSKDGVGSRCKECDKQTSKEFYKDNPEYFRSYKKENRDWILLVKRECNFLYSSPTRNGGYLSGTGICVFCGEVDPFLLELHHPFGPKHSLKIHECANCHCLQHRFPAMLEVTL